MLELLNTSRTQPRPSEPGAASEPCPADAEDSRDNISRRMYAGHDVSSHEVVVRSLLEVLQEFDDASEGDRTVSLCFPTNTNVHRWLFLLLCFCNMRFVSLMSDDVHR